ncbi:MAG: hypothetical protein II169_06735 [Lachnospiraceae bacterium]|nr:hypothetical protein [Lachnospiraceae bacterium]
MGDMVRTCRICSVKDSLPDDVLRYRDRLLSMLPEEQKTSEKELENRLGKCECCDKMVDGTCLSCGCYVVIRAAVYDKQCPLHLW